MTHTTCNIQNALSSIKCSVLEMERDDVSYDIRDQTGSRVSNTFCDMSRGTVTPVSVKSLFNVWFVTALYEKSMPASKTCFSFS